MLDADGLDPRVRPQTDDANRYAEKREGFRRKVGHFEIITSRGNKNYACVRLSLCERVRRTVAGILSLPR